MSDLSNRIPVMRPSLPTFHEMAPYLNRIDQNRVYSNFGPLYCELQERLAQYLGAASSSVALFANGTLALQAAIESVGSAGDEWALPSWTFVASAQAVVCARRRPVFVDVEPRTWAVSPDTARAFPNRLLVAPFGSRPEVNVPLNAHGSTVIDAASCFDACAGIGGSIPARTVLMVSLHATKTLPAGEGALLVGDEGWVADAVQWSNFGFRGSRNATTAGSNAKISEYHCAVGLASLDGWEARRSQWERVRVRAVQFANREGLEIQPSLASGFVTTTLNVLCPPGLSARMASERFSGHGIETRRWWSEGVAAMPAFVSADAPQLPVTEALANRTLGLPFFHDLSDSEFDRIELVSSLAFSSPEA